MPRNELICNIIRKNTHKASYNVSNLMKDIALKHPELSSDDLLFKALDSDDGAKFLQFLSIQRSYCMPCVQYVKP